MAMKWLMNKKMRFSKNQKGLTLVELLAVIVILGVIAAIAVPSIGGIINSSKAKADAQTILLIQDAAELYANQNQPDATATAAITTASLVTAGFLKSAPVSAVTPAKGFNTTVTLTAGVYAATAVVAP